MAESGDERFEAIAEQAHKHGFNRVLGFELIEVGDDWARATVDHNPAYVNPKTERVMHGGVTAAVLDAIVGYAEMAALYDEPDRRVGPTLGLNVSYVATASEPLEVRGELLRMGSQNAILEGEAVGRETDKLVAKAQAVSRVFND